jgi:hypothetical protein
MRCVLYVSIYIYCSNGISDMTDLFAKGVATYNPEGLATAVTVCGKKEPRR